MELLEAHKLRLGQVVVVQVETNIILSFAVFCHLITLNSFFNAQSKGLSFRFCQLIKLNTCSEIILIRKARLVLFRRRLPCRGASLLRIWILSVQFISGGLVLGFKESLSTSYFENMIFKVGGPACGPGVGGGGVGGGCGSNDRGSCCRCFLTSCLNSLPSDHMKYFVLFLLIAQLTALTRRLCAVSTDIVNVPPTRCNKIVTETSIHPVLDSIQQEMILIGKKASRIVLNAKISAQNLACNNISAFTGLRKVQK